MKRDVHFGRRLSPPHRPEHLGKQRRPSPSAGNDRIVSHRDSLSDPPSARRRVISGSTGRQSSGRRQRSRRQGGALSARPRRERRRIVLGPPKEQWPRNPDGSLAMFTKRLDPDD